jgi:hypothetical protein
MAAPIFGAILCIRSRESKLAKLTLPPANADCQVKIGARHLCYFRTTVDRLPLQGKTDATSLLPETLAFSEQDLS